MMKAIISISIFLSFSSFIGVDYTDYAGSDLDSIKRINCPPENKKAEKDLKDYLAIERNAKELSERYGLTIDRTSQNKISPLQSELNQSECKKLIETNTKWLKKALSYSLYQVDDNYFIVTYSLKEKGEFERNSIVIIDSTYEAVAVVIDIGTSNRNNQ